jgi:hypothetical protein
MDEPRARLAILSTSRASAPVEGGHIPSRDPTSTLIDHGDSADSGVLATTAIALQSTSPTFAALDRSYRRPLGDPASSRKAIATKYAELTPKACRAELRRRQLPVVYAKRAPGIADPMRLAGPLRNVRFVTPGLKSVHGLLDCRLVLLLDDLSGVLSNEGVTTVYVDGFYRPKAHLPGKKAPSQHALGLAIDIHSFGTKAGRTLAIERDFAGAIGTPVCGEAATIAPESEDSVKLRNIVCAMARAKAFHYLLTPNYDAAHANHIHSDIQRGARQHVVR